jgi:uncharacterized repeat protein (TIGR02543 family)
MMYNIYQDIRKGSQSLREGAYFMKKFVSILLVMFVALAMFSACDDGSGKKKEEKPTLTVVTLNPTTVSLGFNATRQIAATTVPASTPLTWTSSDETKVTVSSTGLVKGIAEAATAVTITAKAADGGQATCTVTVAAPTYNSDLEEVGQTLVYKAGKLPPLVGVNHFGNDDGTTNEDGSYTFDGTAGAWGGGGAQYDFPDLGTGWSEYNIVEVAFKTTSGSVTAGVKRSGGNTDLYPYPSGSGSVTFNSATGDGKLTFKTVVAEAGEGIGFQRNNGGPATVAIEKVTFTKAAIHTITFSGGEYAAMRAIPPIQIPSGRTVDHGPATSLFYEMPGKPTWTGQTEKVFLGWKTQDNTDFSPTVAVTKDLTLTAQWGALPPPVDMTLNLNPASWPEFPVYSASTTWPSEYATHSYDAVSGKLTLTFNGKNRQMGLIALSEEQAAALIDTDEVPGITIRIDATVTDDGSGVGRAKYEDDNGAMVDESARFRTHVGNPGPTAAGLPGWNSTGGGPEIPLIEQLENYRSFERRDARYRWFLIQAMYKHPVSGVTNDLDAEFPKVTIVISSVKLELGDTTE